MPDVFHIGKAACWDLRVHYWWNISLKALRLMFPESFLIETALVLYFEMVLS